MRWELKGELREESRHREGREEQGLGGPIKRWNVEVLNIIKKRRMKQVLLVCLFAFCAFALTDEEYLQVNTMEVQTEKLQNKLTQYEDLQSCLEAIKAAVQEIQQIISDGESANFIQLATDIITEIEDINNCVTQCKGQEVIKAFIRKMQEP